MAENETMNLNLRKLSQSAFGYNFFNIFIKYHKENVQNVQMRDNEGFLFLWRYLPLLGTHNAILR